MDARGEDIIKRSVRAKDNMSRIIDLIKQCELDQIPPMTRARLASIKHLAQFIETGDIVSAPQTFPLVNTKSV